jgi:hypothetical protein
MTDDRMRTNYVVVPWYVGEDHSAPFGRVPENPDHYWILDRILPHPHDESMFLTFKPGRKRERIDA